jgi:hypothetical protein
MHEFFLADLIKIIYFSIRVDIDLLEEDSPPLLVGIKALHNLTQFLHREKTVRVLVRGGYAVEHLEAVPEVLLTQQLVLLDGSEDEFGEVDMA